MALLTAYWSLDFLLTSLLLFLAAYFYMTRNFNYWKSKGIKEIKPIPFFGNFFSCLFWRISPGEWVQKLYEQCEGLPYMGFYLFDKPALLVRDPELVKNILIKDFQYFVDRHVRAGSADTVGSANMFLIRAPLWKNLRQQSTPVFTSGKMKKMFHLMLEIGDDLEKYLESCTAKDGGQIIEVKEINARYATDSIGSCIFGVEVNSLNDQQSSLRKCGKDIFGFSYSRSIELMLIFFAHDLVERLGIGLNFFSTAANNFMRNLLTTNMNERVKRGYHRDDFIDMLIDLKRTTASSTDPHVFKFEGDNLVAQAATFFAAGFETSSSTMSYALYELALNPDIQTRIRNELNSALKETGGELTYDLVMGLKYLDMAIAEALRKYPPLAFLDRIAARDYKVPGTDLVIEKGTPVYISALGIQKNPDNYPDPEKYDPERFSTENKQTRQSCTYLPFGEGPRICIGIRFGLLEAKIGLIKYLSKFEVIPCDKTSVPLRIDSKAVILAAAGGIFLKCRKIST